MTDESASRVFGLDFVRATAIVLVLVAHASFMFLPLTHQLEAVWMLGHLGVELFFVLSGFLIGAILAKQAEGAHLAVGRFWVRRWLRTLPNYYLFLAINIALARWTEGAWPRAAPYAVFLQNFAWPQPLFFIESWSLAVEEIFYLIAPLLVVAFARVARRVDARLLVAIAIAVATLARVVFVLARDPNWDLSLRMVSIARMDAIAWGVLAMLFCRHARPVPPRHAAIFAWLGAAGSALAITLYLYLPKDTDLFARTGWFSLLSASFAAFLPAASIWMRSGFPDVAERAVRAIARWSYALYLCQLAVMRAMNATFAGNAQTFAGCLLQAVLFMALSVGCAALVYRLFEAPILRVRDRWTHQRSEAAIVVRETGG
jgi:peptidoglycan/LPS O-acetylase OafA/YrhL